MTLKSLYPVIVTPKLAEGRDFYVSHFGFNVVFEADWYVQLHATHEDGASPAELAFMAPNVGSQPDPLHPAFSGSGMILTFDVDDVDRVYRQLNEAGVLEDIVVDLQDEPWGQRHFLFRDPIGTLVDVAMLIPSSGEYAEEDSPPS